MTLKTMMKIIRKTLSHACFALTCLLLSANTAAADKNIDSAIAVASGWALYAEQWEMGRSGERIVQMPVLQTLMHAWIKRYDQDGSVYLELRYPGGEEGEIWVQELADWLVAMGVPARSISMIPGSGADDRILLALQP